MRSPTVRDIVIAGHTGDVATARAGLAHATAEVRIASIGALERTGSLTDADLRVHLLPSTEPSPSVRRRAAEAAALHRDLYLTDVLDDPEWSVVE
ncbi:MAG: hypothetical protein ACKOD2_16885, partial [Ilumatobacteraceae bacterium]